MYIFLVLKKKKLPEDHDKKFDWKMQNWDFKPDWNFRLSWFDADH